MKQFIMDCYQVTETFDRDVGHVAFVSDPILAQRLVDTNKGYRRYSQYRKIITVFDTIEEIESNTKENLRQSGLAKLTASEKEALGLN